MVGFLLFPDNLTKLITSSSHAKAEPLNCFQRYRSYHTLRVSKKKGGTEYLLVDMDGIKKRKTISHFGRPVSSIVEESQIRDATVELEDKIQSAQCGLSTSSISQCEQEIAEVSEPAASLNSSALEDNVQHGALQGESVLPSDKCSVTVEVAASLIRFVKGKGHLSLHMVVVGVVPTLQEVVVVISFPSVVAVVFIAMVDAFPQLTLPNSPTQNLIPSPTPILYPHMPSSPSSFDSTHSTPTTTVSCLVNIGYSNTEDPNLDYSHFVSLPLAIHPELVEKLTNFQNSILGNKVASDENLDGDSNEDISDSEGKGQELNKPHDVTVEIKVEDEKHMKVDLSSIPFVSYSPKSSNTLALSDTGIDKSIFIRPKTFHLTVLMLKLLNKERVNAAAEVLKSIASDVVDALDNRPVSVQLKGLACMKGSLSKAKVLYATVTETGSEDRLMRACQVIIDAFVKAGLVLEKDAKHTLKLHATVMNVRYRKRNQRRKQDSFDACGIFKKFGTEDWGEYLIREAHLSQIFVFDETGYYHCCASIPFPGSLQVD
ncbi:hypothetical protein K2173_024661 [Erythroxylum novogranatense]|uniref:A-kinase anchor protein 7-like phosphoesterase domain-containing protein n=1 Tax=Erythroxylum novogranatense TaxID=1862640 RepID=A0AAV8SW06_9ROSI|nr:hypothetical protein K2173_024661 [Erythroxylum novogranatense]